MDRHKPSTTVDVESFRQKAVERAQAKNMDLLEYLSWQIFLSSKILKSELETQKPAMDNQEYVAVATDAQEIYEGSRLLVSEVT